MTNLDWNRVDRLLEQLLELEPEQRHVHLLRELPDEPELRAHLLRILATEEHDESFLTWPKAPTTEPIQVGRYCLKELIGRGGMGEVWLAERADGVYEGRVALKLLQHGLTTHQHRRRFGAERQVLAWLDHPGIARLLDGGVHTDGRPYLVMEYVEGLDLAQHVSQHGSELGLVERLRLFELICEAVAHAHSRGVLHRDLKPNNVLVERTGAIRLIDFGIAKVFQDGEGRESFELTLTGQRFFSPWYASPEQVRGQAVGPPSDVYALGVMLYELLTGEKPYEANTPSLAELERVVCETRVRRPSDHPGDPAWRSTLRRDLDWIVGTALRKEPERRYADAGELLADVRRFRAGEAVLARPDSALYRASSFSRRHRLLVGGALALLLILSSSLVVISLLLRDSLASAREAMETAYGAHLQSAEAALRNGLSSTARIQLEATPAELRGWEFRHLMARTDRSRQRGVLPSSVGNRHSLAVSPDGRFLAGTLMNSLYLYEASSLVRIARGDAENRLPQSRHSPGQVAFHPDGRLVAGAFAEGTLRIWGLPELTPVASFEVDGEPLTGVVFDPQGLWIAGASQAGTLAVFRLVDGARLGQARVTDEVGQITLAAHPSGALLASAGWDEELRVWSVPGLDLVQSFSGHTMDIHDLAFLPGGQRIVTSSLDGSLRVWNLDHERDDRPLRIHAAAPTSLAVDPLSGDVWSGDEQGTILRWDPDTGQILARLLGHRGTVTGLTCSPDGKSLFSADGSHSDLLAWDSGSDDVRELGVCELTYWIDTREDRVTLLQPSGIAASWSWPELRPLDPLEPTASPLIGGGWSSAAGRLVLAETDGSVWLADMASGERFEICRIQAGLSRCWVSADLALLREVSLLGGERLLRVPVRAGASPTPVACPLCGDAPSQPRISAAAPDHDGSFLLLDPEGHLLRVDREGVSLQGHIDVPFGNDVWPHIAIDPMGRALLVGHAGGLSLWDLSRMREVWRQPECGVAPCSVFLPDGSRVFAGCADGSIIVLDSTDGRVLLSLTGQSGSINALAIAPDNDTLISLSRPGRMRFWEAPR